MKNKISSVGISLPKKVVTNHELAKIVDTSDEWVRSRTGIEQRHVCEEGESTSSLATAAAKKALNAAGISANQVDLIIVGTTTPDLSFPSVASLVQLHLGIPQAATMDVQAACSGFVHALNVADALMKTGQYKTALVIGADTYTNLVDWKDRSTCVLFGDGAGAVVVESGAKEGIISGKMGGDATGVSALRATGGVASTKTAGFVEMNGREVFKNAVRKFDEMTKEALEKAGITLSDVDYIVPHQANRRITESLLKSLGVDETKVISTVEKHGNTSAASIPLALGVAAEDGRLKPGQTLLLIAFGAGFTWSYSLLKWG